MVGLMAPSEFEESQRKAHEDDVCVRIIKVPEPTKERLFEILKQYAGHKFSCDYLAPMWHQGPCDCGWAAVEIELGLKVAVDTETTGTSG